MPLIEAPEQHYCHQPAITWVEKEQREREVEEEVGFGPFRRTVMRMQTYEVPVQRSLNVRSLYACDVCGQRWILLDKEWGKGWYQLQWYHSVPKEMWPEGSEVDRKLRAAVMVAVTSIALLTTLMLMGMGLIR